jgi:hypothetical protein
MIYPAPNPDAQGNIRHGNAVFQAGIRDPDAVYLAHLWWNRGTSAEHHFANGYREACKTAGEPIGNSLRYLDWVISPEDKAIARQLRQDNPNGKWP